VGVRSVTARAFRGDAWPRMITVVNAMTSAGPDYVTRYGWTAQTVRIVLFALLLVVLGFLHPGIPPALGVTVGVVCLCSLLWLLAIPLFGRVALRVDASGITLGGSPLPIGPRPDCVPWDEIVSVALWSQRAGGTTIRYVGLRRTEGAAPLAGAPGPRRRRYAAAVVPGVPADLVAASRPVFMWRLDRAGLEAATAAFAPTVSILDLDRPH
jgi:hypothetical protein